MKKKELIQEIESLKTIIRNSKKTEQKEIINSVAEQLRTLGHLDLEENINSNGFVREKTLIFTLKLIQYE